MKTIGVLGGMGPAATADFLQKLVDSTDAATDQEHPKVLLWSNPTIPDRTEAIVNNGEDPTPHLLDGAQLLQRGGADVFAVPCNGAHAFLPEVVKNVDIELVSILDATVYKLQQLSPTPKKIGLLASEATVQAELYKKALEKAGFELLAPNHEERHGKKEYTAFNSERIS